MTRTEKRGKRSKPSKRPGRKAAANRLKRELLRETMAALLLLC